MASIKKYIALITIILFSSQSLFAFWPVQMSHKTLALTEFYNSGENGQGQELGQQIYTQMEQSLGSDARILLEHASIEKPEFATLETVIASGKTVGADAILVGAYSQIGGMTKIDAQLIDVATNEVLHSDTKYLMQGDDLSSVLKNLASEIQTTLVGDIPIAKEPVQPAELTQSQSNQMASAVNNAAVSGTATKSAAATGAGTSWLLWTAAGIGVAGGAYLLYNAVNTNTSTVSIQIPLP
jgi:hypothetical protein